MGGGLTGRPLFHWRHTEPGAAGGRLKLMDHVIGTAGWTIPAKDAGAFPAQGSSLERYAALLSGVEINSSFHRAHRRTTWQRWADSVPAGFQFAVKIPKTISHHGKLIDCQGLVAAFLDDIEPLGDKLSVLLLQLPPKLALEQTVAAPFLEQLRTQSPCAIACEPRHPSWFDAEADGLLQDLGVARVAADPAVTPAAARPGGWRGLSYWRLHGSPSMYRSSYDDGRLEIYASLLRDDRSLGGAVWCMFDNTASSAAMSDALALDCLLRNPSSQAGLNGR
jgi:uncharacterized protein YecE (DUF72 family)